MKRLKTFFYWGILQSVWRWRGCLDVGDDVLSAGWDHLRFNLIPVLVLSIFWQIFLGCLCQTWALCYHGVPDSSGFLGWERVLTKPTDEVGWQCCTKHRGSLCPCQDALHSLCVWALMRHGANRSLISAGPGTKWEEVENHQMTAGSTVKGKCLW